MMMMLLTLLLYKQKQQQQQLMPMSLGHKRKTCSCIHNWIKAFSSGWFSSPLSPHPSAHRTPPNIYLTAMEKSFFEKLLHTNKG